MMTYISNPKRWRYIPFNTYSGYENMAIDETLLDQVINNRSPNILRFYQWNPSTATIGAHQSLHAEIDMEFAEKNQIQVVRRISGGGAVLHQSKIEITYAIICHLSQIPQRFPSVRSYSSNIPRPYHAILEALAVGLEMVGVPIGIDKIHCPALLVDGKKISGNAQIIRNQVLLQHGTILLEVDPEFMYQVLRAPVGVSYTRMVQSVRTKVTGINKFTSFQTDDLEIDKIIQNLKNGFKKIFDIQFITQGIKKTEQEKINRLIREKYNSKDWLYKYP